MDRAAGTHFSCDFADDRTDRSSKELASPPLLRMKCSRPLTRGILKRSMGTIALNGKGNRVYFSQMRWSQAGPSLMHFAVSIAVRVRFRRCGVYDGTDTVAGVGFTRAGRLTRSACRTGVVPVAYSRRPAKLATFPNGCRAPLV